jgi:transaldolase
VLHNNTYLSWVIDNTTTKWWHDSAEPSELQRGLQRGAVGVTTNPFLTNLALSKNRDAWAAEIAEVLSAHLPPEAKAEALMRIPVTRAAEKLLPEYERSGGSIGYVCAQVNPARACDRDSMLAMAERFHAWAPNIAVKLPATAAGLDVLEDCIARGITITATVSFTLPQAIAVAERCRQGVRRARSSGLEPGRCFAVIMIGRLDDYLREVAQDSRAGIPESDIRQAGLAVTKRAYAIYKERGYEAVLLVAALRGDYHLTELAGADLVMSIAPGYQEIFVSRDLPREERIQAEVQAEVVERLSRLPEFVRSYAPDGMLPEDFITYGVTQRTLSQFYDAGWKLLETWGML